jgi:hypothetical protein
MIIHLSGFSVCRINTGGWYHYMFAFRPHAAAAAATATTGTAGLCTIHSSAWS